MTECNTVKDRLKLFISHLNISEREFEEKCSLSYGYIYSMKKGIGQNKLDIISNLFPELNLSWLMFGEGGMLKSQQNIGDVKNSTIVGSNVSGNGNRITHYSKEEEDCKREVEYLKAIIVEKDTLITEKERLIQVLLDKK